MRFAGGGIASASASRIGQRKVRSMVIHELDRMIEVDLLRRGVTAYRHTSIEGDAGHAGFRQMTEMEVPEIIGAEPLASQLAHFVSAGPRRGRPRGRAGVDPAGAPRGGPGPVSQSLTGTNVGGAVRIQLDAGDGAGGHTGNDGAWAARRRVTTAPAADDGLVADGDAHVDHGVRAQEDAVADHHRSALDLTEPAAADTALRGGVGVDVDARRHVTARADPQAAGSRR